MHSKSLSIMILISLILAIICFSDTWAQTDCEALRQQLEQVRKELAEKESRWETMPPGREKDRLEKECHRLDDRRGKLRKQYDDCIKGIQRQTEPKPQPSDFWLYVVIVAIIIAVVSIIVLINLFIKGRQPRLPLPTQSAPGTGGEPSSLPAKINPQVLAAIITAVASIIVALIGLLRR